MKCRTFPKFRIHPYSATMAFYDPLADRQADTGALKLFSAVQPLEYQEDALEILSLDTYSIVTDSNMPQISFISGRYTDQGKFRSPEFDRVGEQVLKELHHL